MTMEQMRTFLAVADCLNFTKAAERLYLSQPTVSRQIQSLEEECKTPLLVRTRKEVRLTPAGAIMVSHLKKSLEEIEAGLEEIQASSNALGERENLTIYDLKDETFIAPDEKDSPFRLEDTNNLLSHYGFQCKKMKYVKNHESQLLNVAAGNGVAIACGDVPQVKNSMLFHFLELSKEEHVLYMIYAWKKENYNPALALFLNGLSEEDES